MDTSDLTPITQAIVERDMLERLENSWMREGRGLTFEDYCIYVRKVGHSNYRKYDKAHWIDSDIMDKSYAWNKLRGYSYA